MNRTLSLALLLALVAAPLAAQRDSLYLRGRQQLNRADYAGAAVTLAEAIRRPASPARRREAMYWRAFALYQHRDTVLARKQLADLLAEPGGRDAHPDVATLAARLGLQDAVTSGECGSSDAANAERLMRLRSAEGRSEARGILRPPVRCGPLTQRSAIALLRESGEATDHGVLRDLVHQDVEDLVRTDAINALAGDDSPATIATLEAVMRESGATLSRAAAVNTLAALPGEQGAAAIRRLLVDSMVSVTARQSLFSMAGRREASILPDRWLREQFWALPREGSSIRSTVLGLLVTRSGAENLEFVWQVAGRDDAGELAQLTALQGIGSRHSPRELRRLFDATSSQLVRYGVIEALRKRGDRDAIAALRDIAERGPNAEVRAAAKAGAQ